MMEKTIRIMSQETSGLSGPLKNCKLQLKARARSFGKLVKTQVPQAVQRENSLDAHIVL